MTFSQKPQNSMKKIFLFFIIGVIFGGIWTFIILNKTNFLDYQGNNSSFSQNSQDFNNWWNDVKNDNFLTSNKNFSTDKINKVYSLLRNNYYQFESKSIKEVEDSFISSMISSLTDDYSEYFTETEAKDFYESLSGDFEWIGAVIDDHEKWVQIQRVLPTSPAEKAGLQKWDIVISGNDISFVGMKSSDAVKIIRGKKWTTVKITYIRGEEQKEIEVTRDVVNVPSVDSKVLENSELGYILVNSFGDHTSSEFIKQFEELKKQNIKWLIIDLRYNGGGLLETAQSLLSYLLPINTPIVTTKENNSSKNITMYTKIFSTRDTKIPIIILVNEYSASASEIVAGALQDYGRAIIVGKKTFGKGSVQQMYDLSDWTMVKFTVAHWYTPKDKNIDKEWITPDIIIELTEEDYKNNSDKQLEWAKNILEEYIKNPNISEIINKFKK